MKLPTLSFCFETLLPTKKKLPNASLDLQKCSSARNSIEKTGIREPILQAGIYIGNGCPRRTLFNEDICLKLGLWMIVLPYQTDGNAACRR